MSFVAADPYPTPDGEIPRRRTVGSRAADGAETGAGGPAAGLTLRAMPRAARNASTSSPGEESTCARVRAMMMIMTFVYVRHGSRERRFAQ